MRGTTHRRIPQSNATTAIPSHAQRAHRGSPPGISQCSASTPTASHKSAAAPAPSRKLVIATPL